MRRLMALALLALVAAALFARSAWAEDLPQGNFSPSECLACHERETPRIVDSWRRDVHARSEKPVGCIACHGSSHEGSLVMARQSGACIGCHGGNAAAPVRSYLISKHGVITTLEASSWDWAQALSAANFRAPTCAYCHMHEGGHDTVSLEDIERSCLDCHSTRFAETMLESARRALRIGELKVIEAREAVEAARKEGYPEPETGAHLEMLLAAMETVSMSSLRAGYAHQSPDFQWWYGMAALDGDLIQIKSEITRWKRGRPE